MVGKLQAGLVQVKEEILHAAGVLGEAVHESFHSKMAPFAEEMDDKLQNVQELSSKAINAVKHVREFYGEPFKPDNPIHILRVVGDFLTIFDNVRDSIKAEEAAEALRKRLEKASEDQRLMKQKLSPKPKPVRVLDTVEAVHAELISKTKKISPIRSPGNASTTESEPDALSPRARFLAQRSMRSPPRGKQLDFENENEDKA